jgi:hypothetical protein
VKQTKEKIILFMVKYAPKNPEKNKVNQGKVSIQEKIIPDMGNHLQKKPEENKVKK